MDINFFFKDAERVEFYNRYDKRVKTPGGGGQIIPFLPKISFQEKFMVFEKIFFARNEAFLILYMLQGSKRVK